MSETARLPTYQLRVQNTVTPASMKKIWIDYVESTYVGWPLLDPSLASFQNVIAILQKQMPAYHR